jgi:hypothetical protein
VTPAGNEVTAASPRGPGPVKLVDAQGQLHQHACDLTCLMLVGFARRGFEPVLGFGFLLGGQEFPNREPFVPQLAFRKVFRKGPSATAAGP